MRISRNFFIACVRAYRLTLSPLFHSLGVGCRFTPTCSAKHVPGYVENHDALKAAGVDEIWCVSVNDAFVMGAWARDQKTGAKVRMLGDGSAASLSCK